MNRKIIAAILLLVGIGVAVFSFVRLPDTVVVQIDFEGKPSSTVPKLVAIMLPFILTCAGSLLVCFGKEKNIKKSTLVSAIGILVSVITLVVNLIDISSIV